MVTSPCQEGAPFTVKAVKRGARALLFQIKAHAGTAGVDDRATCMLLTVLTVLGLLSLLQKRWICCVNSLTIGNTFVIFLITIFLLHIATYWPGMLSTEFSVVVDLCEQCFHTISRVNAESF